MGEDGVDINIFPLSKKNMGEDGESTKEHQVGGAAVGEAMRS
jgi:hypothetical protein